MFKHFDLKIYTFYVLDLFYRVYNIFKIIDIFKIFKNTIK
jgi:hypothetical protein